MATIKGLWLLKDSIITWEGLPIGYKNTININGRVFKSGSWNNFTQIRVVEDSQFPGWKNQIVPISEGGKDINLIDMNFKWWTGFEYDQFIYFGEEPQEIDEVVFTLITENATEHNYNDFFVTLNGNFVWKKQINENDKFLNYMFYISGSAVEPDQNGIMDGFMILTPDEEMAGAYGCKAGVWTLGRIIINFNTEEQTFGFYQEGAWTSDDIRSFTLNNVETSKSLAQYILENTEGQPSNKDLLINKLNELANAIKNRHQSLTLPMKLEAMVYSLGGDVRDVPELSKDAFFYLMNEMADAISTYNNVELPLTIEEMIAALSGVLKTFNIIDHTYYTYLEDELQFEEGMTWIEWVGSKYNTTNGKIDIWANEVVRYDGRELHRPATDQIVETDYYVRTQDGGGVA